MVDYSAALKRPFSDINKLIIAILISMIPIVNFIFTGYTLEIAKTAMKNSLKLPEWKNIGRLFVEGLLMMVIVIIYSLPVTIIALLVLIIAVLLLIALKAAAGLAPAIIIGVILAILFIIAVTMWGIFMMGVMLRYAETRKFSSAFDFGYIKQKVFRSKFIGALCVVFTAAFIIAFLAQVIISFAMAPLAVVSQQTDMLLWLFSFLAGLILSTITSSIIAIFMYTALGQAYAEK